MEEINVIKEMKKLDKNPLKISNSTTLNEQVFLEFLQTESIQTSSKNLSIFDQKVIKKVLNSEKNVEKLKIIFYQSNTLNKFILNYENQLIKYIYLKFLDVPKTDISHVLKIPKLLSLPKYKIIFWQLLFTTKKQDTFKAEFQKLIKDISKNHSKKKVLEILNFGIALSKKQHLKN